MNCYLAQAEDFVDWHFFLTEQAESAIVALNCSGMLLGTQPIRFFFLSRCIVSVMQVSSITI